MVFKILSNFWRRFFQQIWWRWNLFILITACFQDKSSLSGCFKKLSYFAVMLQPLEFTPFSTIVSVRGCRYGMNLKFVLGIPLVKWWRLVTSLASLTIVTGVYFADQNLIFDYVNKNWKWRHQSTSSVKETYFKKFQGLILSLT